MFPYTHCFVDSHITVYDILNVAEIHNSSFDMPEDTFFQTRTRADQHEFGLAYNVSDNARAISGMQLAGEVLSYLNGTITSAGAKKLGIQFGAYATFFSFFGLANLTEASPNFYGIPDYASSMVFELFTTADTSSGFPSQDDMQVRFLYYNGTSANSSDPQVFPLFGQSETAVPWNAFAGNLSTFAVRDTQHWCHVCGNTTGTCAQYATANSASNGGASGSSSGGRGNGLSPAVNGVIGAMVTLAVVLGLEALVMLLGGWRLVSKKALAGARMAESGVEAKA